MGRKPEPDLPEDIFEEACLAWSRTEGAAEEQEEDFADARKAAAQLELFGGRLSSGYKRVSSDLPGFLDAAVKKANSISELQSAIQSKVEELRNLGRRRPGDKQVGSYSGLNMQGLRAFASILKDWYEQDPSRRWAQSGGSARAARGKTDARKKAYSPAEKFLQRHAERVDPSVTLENARTVIRAPYGRRR